MTSRSVFGGARASVASHLATRREYAHRLSVASRASKVSSASRARRERMSRSSAYSIASLQSEGSILDRWLHLKKPGEAPDSCLGMLVYNPHFETGGGCLIFCNFIVMTMETHAAATGDDNILRFAAFANNVFLLLYTVELAVRLYVLKMSFFQAGWNLLDLFIVITGILGEMMEILNMNSGVDQVMKLKVSKSVRMLRLFRLTRLFVAFRELYVLVAGIARCMKTLFWASGLIFVMLNIWAILGVEFLDERVQELIPSGKYRTCNWCADAFSNIWTANLTWFQIISTEDWATIGRPLAEEFVWPYGFFIFNTFTVVWGLLNLIVAAIVDSSIVAREDDMAMAAELAQHDQKKAWESFAEICRDMDSDGSGDITVDEFQEFLSNNDELQCHMTFMGIKDDDVVHLLKLMDEAGTGVLECEEFIQQFTSMRTLVEKTALFYLLRYSQSMRSRIKEQGYAIQSMRKDLASLSKSLTTIDFAHNFHDAAADASRKSVRQSRKSVRQTTFDFSTDSTVTVDFERPDFEKHVQAGDHWGIATQGVADMHEQESEKPDFEKHVQAGDDWGTATPGVAEMHEQESDYTKDSLQTHVQTVNNGGAATPGAVKMMEQDLRMTAQPETPCVDVERLPPGWYYFGTSLPPAASEWCKSIDLMGKAKCADDFCAPHVGNGVAEKSLVTTNAQRWEPLPPNICRVHNANHVYIHAPTLDVQLSQEVMEHVTNLDRFLDSKFSALALDDHLMRGVEDAKHCSVPTKDGDPIQNVLNAIENDSLNVW